MRLLASLALAAVALQPGILYAQTSSPDGQEERFDINTAASISGSELMAQPEGLSSCDIYYEFGSTPVVITGPLSEVSAGTEVSFNGTIGNKNTYEIKDAALWVKVMKGRASEKEQNGPEVVDWFEVIDSVDLPAQGSVPFSGTWNVPADARTGEYKIVTFVVSSDRFNFQGLSFTDDVVGVAYPFSVVNGTEAGAYFAKDGVSVAGYPFAFAAFPPRVEQAATVPVVATIQNDTPAPFRGQVEWKLYSWDAVTEEHFLEEKTQDVEVHPNATAEVTYEITDTEHSVYYAVGTLHTPGSDSKSIIGVRVVREGINTPRFNFVGIHPNEDGTATAVACLHSTGLAPTDNARVELSTYRAGFIGKILNLMGPLTSTTYEGRVGTEIYALAAAVGSDSHVVSASLWQGDEHIDTVTLNYCADACTSWTQYLIVVAAVFVLGLALFVVTIMLKRRRAVSVHTPSAPTPPYAS